MAKCARALRKKQRKSKEHAVKSGVALAAPDFRIYTMERYEYTVVDHVGIVDQMVGQTLDDVLLVHQAKLVHQFQGIAVIQTKSGAFLGVRWRIILP